MFGGNPAGRHFPHPAVKRAEEAAKKAVEPKQEWHPYDPNDPVNPFSPESLQAAWEKAEAQMRAEGIDVEELMKKAAKALPETLPGDERGGVK